MPCPNAASRALAESATGGASLFSGSEEAGAAGKMTGQTRILCPGLTFILQLFTSPYPMRKGTKVSWKYGIGSATGKIESVHKEPVTRKIKGHDIHRNGSAEDPALLIVQENGNKVLKLQSEVKVAS
jgi:hypothetical protein